MLRTAAALEIDMIIAIEVLKHGAIAVDLPNWGRRIMGDPKQGHFAVTQLEQAATDPTPQPEPADDATAAAVATIDDQEQIATLLKMIQAGDADGINTILRNAGMEIVPIAKPNGGDDGTTETGDTG